MTTPLTKTVRKLMQYAHVYGWERAAGQEQPNEKRTEEARVKLRDEIRLALQRAHQAGRESML
jgi:hypothetical protein